MLIPASDQYSLAATLFFLLTGAMLPDGIARATGNTDLPEQAASRIPIDIQTCLIKALQINPTDRYADVQSFIDALSSIIRTSPDLSTQSTRNSRLLQRKVFNRWIAFIVGAISLGLLLTVGWFLFRQVSEPLKPSPITKVETTLTETKTVAANIEQPAVERTSTIRPTELPVVPDRNKPTPLGGLSGTYAYVSERTGIPQIYIGSTTSEKSTQLTNVSEGACQPDWSPDGKRLAFISPCPPKSELVGRTEPYIGAGLFLLAINDGQVIPIPSQPGGDFDPAWSPDGEKILYTSIRSNFPQIFLFDILSEETTQLTDTTGGNRQPSWSQDGTRLAFSSYRKGSWQIWIMTANGSNPTAFSIQNNGAAFSADWSPDDSAIVYSQTNSYRLVSKPTADEKLPEVVLNPRLTGASNPDISPDGLWILFDSKIGGNFQIYRISINGSGAESITPGDEISYHPAWKPVH
jgi:hypothetical protein